MFNICGNLMLLYFLEMKLSSVYIFTEWQIIIWQKYYFSQFILSIKYTFWAPPMVSTLKNTAQKFSLFPPGTYLVLFYLNSLLLSWPPIMLSSPYICILSIPLVLSQVCSWQILSKLLQGSDISPFSTFSSN